MQQIDPNFDERNAGFNRFSKFVIEAGQKGVVLLNKLDNGQYEVAPAPGGLAATSRPRTTGEGGREEPAPGRRPEQGDARTREDGARRGRGRRGRGGRDRSGARDAAAHRDRVNGSARPEGGQHASPRQDRGDGVLTLARAFQLMTQALSEFRSPVGQEALRLRMVAMHGREDPLLDASRFPRLLRQANDAEVADVRKVGDDDYEISAQRVPSRPALPPAPPQEELAALPPAEGPPDVAASASRENGQRLGLRFRRGSRGPVRAADIPLIGVVRIEPTVEPAEPVPAAPSAEVVEEAARRPRPRRPPRKRVSAVPDAAQPQIEPGGEAAPPKRPRSRSRKKPE
jgi:hypothetical protein